MNTIRSSLILVILLGVAAFLWIFGDVCFGELSFVFRDAAHFYFPSLSRIQSIWETDWPYWNHLEELGRPLLADPTASIFYPGKLVFCLPISFAKAYLLLILMHYVLAIFNTFWTARGIGCSTIASGHAAFSYSFGGYVLGQHCNLIYLTSAAWFPLGILFVWRISSSVTANRMIGLAFVHAMMILGGDPQAAYNLALIQLILVGYRFRYRAKLNPSGIGESVDAKSGIPLLQGLVSVAIPLFMGVSISAIQFLPSMEWASSSDRSHHAIDIQPFSSPSIDNLSNTKPTTIGEQEASASRIASLKTYRFSIGPWRWLELVWPNALGKQYPINQRWGNLIPAENGVWTPTLYVGLVPVSLVVFVWRRCQCIELRWLRAVVILSALGSLGWYGLGWIWNEIAFALGIKQELWAPLGGIYSLMNLSLPMYDQFRYPAKLWLMFASASSLIAGRAFDIGCESDKKRFSKFVSWFAIFSFLILVLVSTLGVNLFSSSPQTDRLFGPFDAEGTVRVVQISLLHSVVVSILLCAFVYFLHGRRVLPWLLLTLSVIDVSTANAWSVVSANTEIWRAKSNIAQEIKLHAFESKIDWFRVFRPYGKSWYPRSWAIESSESRQIEGLAWDVETLNPRYGLLESIASVRVSTSFSSAEFDELMRVALINGLPNPEVLDALGIAYVIGTADAIRNRTDLEVVFTETLFDETVCVGHNSDAFPLAWVVHHSTPSMLDRPDKIVNQIFGDQKFIASRLTSTASSKVSLGSHDELPDDEEIREVDALDVTNPNRIKLHAHLRKRGLLVISQQFVPGWRCVALNASSREKLEPDVIRANGIMTAVELPSGDFEVVFDYSPKSIRIGFLISGSAVVVCVLIVLFRRRHDQHQIA